MSSVRFLLWLAIILGTVLRFYRLPDLMPFIGDQAWFYLAARDALLGRGLPLLGITASITWLHQGPLWTYLLVPLIAHPVLPAILTSLAGVISIYLIYFLGGWPASLLLSALPLSVLQSRMPYHTSLIPLFSILFSLFPSQARFPSRFIFRFSLPVASAHFHFLARHVFPPSAHPRFYFGHSTVSLGWPYSNVWHLCLDRQAHPTGFTGSSISTAYLVVLLVPAILIASWFFNRLPKSFRILAVMIYLGFSIWNLEFSLGPSFSSRLSLSRAILSQSQTSSPEIVMSDPNFVPPPCLMNTLSGGSPHHSLRLPLPLPYPRRTSNLQSARINLERPRLFDIVRSCQPKNSRKQFVENSYYHIYNRGVEKRQIFMDEMDYSVLFPT